MLSLLRQSQPRLSLLRSMTTTSQLFAGASVPATTGGKSSEISPAESVAQTERIMQRNLQNQESTVGTFDKFVKDRTKMWNEKHEIYFGKERDFKNFPTMKQPEYIPKVRVGILPDSWFQALYNKTGVTGPYLFLWGGVTFLLSKEIIVIDHEFMEFVFFTGYMYCLTKFAGPYVADFLDKGIEKSKDDSYRKVLSDLRADSDAVIKRADGDISNQSALKQIFQAKRDNVDFQLELAYRQRLESMHKAVKARLDYQVLKESLRRQFQQDHMVHWIVDNAVKGVTPQLEKDILGQCIKDLQAMAKRQPSASTA